jgi:hypothetical protein
MKKFDMNIKSVLYYDLINPLLEYGFFVCFINKEFRILFC